MLPDPKDSRDLKDTKDKDHRASSASPVSLRSLRSLRFGVPFTGTNSCCKVPFPRSTIKTSLFTPK